MIPLRRRNRFILLSFLFPLSVYAQQIDLYSEKNISEYAQYLFRTKQYIYAAEEYERLFFLYPENENYQLGLLRSYRFGGDYPKGIFVYESLRKQGERPGIEILREYSKLNLLSGNLSNNTLLIHDPEIDMDFRNNLDLTMRLMSVPDYTGDLTGIDPDRADKGLMELYNSRDQIRYKSRFLAGSFSTLVPGMGKVYSGRWKDGLVSLLFVGATGFQAYRGFSQKGSESIYGWIMGSLSVGFYIGNIFGSVKAAKIYNTNQNRIYSEKVTHYYIDHF